MARGAARPGAAAKWKDVACREILHRMCQPARHRISPWITGAKSFGLQGGEIVHRASCENRFAGSGILQRARDKLRLFAEEFRDDENHDGTEEAATEQQINERIAGRRERRDETDERDHSD